MINNGKQYSLTARMKMSRDIVKGMIYVHQHGVTHHDLKVCTLLKQSLHLSRVIVA